MAKSKALTAKEVESLPRGMYADGGGLWLRKQSQDSGQWVLRVSLYGQRREMGLGGIRKIGLAEARKLATKAQLLARDGIDPISAREEQRLEAQRDMRTFESVALDCFEARKAELKNGGKAGRWLSPLQIHVFPRLGKRPIARLNQIDIRDTLKPIWHTKADTARKAMNRVSVVFKHAAALGLGVDMQAPEKAKALLGKTTHKAKNIPALPWAEVPPFYQSLEEPTTAHLALRLLILTGLRSAPIRLAHESQFDGDVWTVPAENMKAREGKAEEFRCPLSAEAQRVVELANSMGRDGYLFPSVKRGVISDMTMSALMKRRGMEARPHGFRSSLRSWLADCTVAPHEIAEAMLQHKTGNAVSRAYQRSDHLERRRVLMEMWAQHVTGQASGEVVEFRGHGQ